MIPKAVLQWFTQRSFTHKDRRAALAELSKLERELFIRTLPPIPSVGDKLRVTKQSGRDGFEAGAIVQVIASGKGNGGFKYAMVAMVDDAGETIKQRMVPLQYLEPIQA